jgi:hypothetical protein
MTKPTSGPSISVLRDQCPKPAINRLLALQNKKPTGFDVCFVEVGMNPRPWAKNAELIFSPV